MGLVISTRKPGESRVFFIIGFNKKTPDIRPVF